jgi:STE24 endopeptidase
LLLALTCLAAAPAVARTRLDARVDTLSTHALMTRSAAGLVDAGRQTHARAIADLRHLAAAGFGIAQVLAFWWLWRSGTSARIRDWMRRRTRSRLAQRAVVGAALGVTSALAALPFAFAGYRISFAIGVTRLHASSWLAGYLERIAGDALIGALIVVVVLGLVERTHLWYLIVAGLLVCGALAGSMFGPVLPFAPQLKMTPHALVATQAIAAQRLGVPGTPVVMLDTARHGGGIRVAASGIGPTRRVSVTDVTLDHLSPPELLAALELADAHVARGDVLRQTLAATILFIITVAAAVLISDRVGFRRDDDALSRLALVATWLGVVATITYPIYNAYHRSLESASDALALQAGADRAATARLFIREADDGLEPLCDRRTVRWYFDDTPPPGARIAQAAGTVDPCPPAVQ